MSASDSIEPSRSESVPDSKSLPASGVRSISTELIHHAYEAPTGFDSMVTGVHKASTILFRDMAALRARSWKEKTGYTYGLHGTPTTFTLEERIATLEGGLHTLLAPSGLAAIALVDLALLKSGDELLIPDNVYGPNKELARNELTSWGIAHRFYDPMDTAGFEAAFTSNTRLVWIEAPGSVTMEFPDLAALTRIAKSRGAITALDITWAAGLAFDAFDLTRAQGGERLAVDIAVQALTKYPSGGGDVLMGSITTRDEALHLKLKFAHMRLGVGVGANDAEAVLRSLPSLDLRYEAHDRAGRALAEWWSHRPEIVQVLHPAFEGSPGHSHWKASCTRAAGLFSIVFDERYSPAQVDAFCDALKLFGIGYSWAGPMSLVVPYDLSAIRRDPRWRGTLVRFSVGLEAIDDLIADCEQALVALGS